MKTLAALLVLAIALVQAEPLNEYLDLPSTEYIIEYVTPNGYDYYASAPIPYYRQGRDIPSQTSYNDPHFLNLAYLPLAAWPMYSRQARHGPWDYYPGYYDAGYYPGYGYGGGYPYFGMNFGDFGYGIFKRSVPDEAPVSEMNSGMEDSDSSAIMGRSAHHNTEHVDHETSEEIKEVTKREAFGGMGMGMGMGGGMGGGMGMGMGGGGMGMGAGMGFGRKKREAEPTLGWLKAKKMAKKGYRPYRPMGGYPRMDSGMGMGAGMGMGGGGMGMGAGMGMG